LLPTLCAVTGIPVPSDRVIDGASFLPILAGQPIQRKTPLYWQFNVAHSKPKVAMRIGDWKILASLSGKNVKPYGDIRPEDQQSIKTSELQAFELYHLREDIGETTDRAQSEPQRLKELSATLNSLYHEVRDESPVWPQWTWPRYDGRRIREFVESLKKSAGVKPKGKKSVQ
jgi:arylsulfatase A